MSYIHDKRIVLTLDAGGTNFVFSAMQGMTEVAKPVRLPAHAKELDKSLDTMVQGFKQVMEQLPQKPVAISFAFPGPADYPNGIIDNMGNLPAYGGGVALGPFLEETFGIPVFINNDGDLFVYGEAIAGLLPIVNQMLADAGSPKRFNNLFGITLGTGFGAGIVRDGQLYIGDNSAAGEIWITRNKRYPKCFAEEGVSIRAVQGTYARVAGIDPATAPSPKDIYEIGIGKQPGHKAAALQAFAEMGEVIGDALANAITLLDGLIVIGGDGSLTGALALHRQGVKVVGVPGSIDNDIWGTNMAIGVDTAMNTIMDAVDKLRDTASSHGRVFLVETMGRSSGYLAVMAGIVSGAEIVLIPERTVTLEEIAKAVESAYLRGKTHAFIINAEGSGHKTEELAKALEDMDVGFQTRVTILGHIQRGGSPTAYDRLLASRMGVKAVEALMAGMSGVMTGLQGRGIDYIPLEEVIAGKREVNMEYYEMVGLLAR